MPVFEIAMGIYYQSTYYVAKKPTYKQDVVFFERFCYDYISLFGVNILFLDIHQLELITRKIYSAVTFNFNAKTNQPGGVQMRAYECIEPAFTEQSLLVAMQELNTLKNE
jgi:hypothetical protein